VSQRASSTIVDATSFRGRIRRAHCAYLARILLRRSLRGLPPLSRQALRVAEIGWHLMMERLKPKLLETAKGRKLEEFA
jgi:hypothetical protein